MAVHAMEGRHSSRRPTKRSRLRSANECSTSSSESGAEIIAEDLGVVPDFVRARSSAWRVPGFRVARWEREWHVKGQPVQGSRRLSGPFVVTSGTHDTETLATWWAEAPRERA